MLMCQPDTWAPLKDTGSDSLGLAKDLGLCISNKLPGTAMQPVHGPQLEQRGSSIQMVCQYLHPLRLLQKNCFLLFQNAQIKKHHR